jgi:rhodanese-related sulfurtransferase
VAKALASGRRAEIADLLAQGERRQGFRARRLIDGFPEWKRAGLPVAAPAGAGRS